MRSKSEPHLVWAAACPRQHRDKVHLKCCMAIMSCLGKKPAERCPPSVDSPSRVVERKGQNTSLRLASDAFRAHDMGPDGLNNWVERHHAGADPIRRRSRHRFRSLAGTCCPAPSPAGSARQSHAGSDGRASAPQWSPRNPVRRTNHREEIATFSLNLPPGLCGRIHISHCVCGVRRCGGGVVDKRQQLVVVNNPGIGHVHDVLGMHLEASGKQIA
jgi:hypothetical protein